MEGIEFSVARTDTQMSPYDIAKGMDDLIMRNLIYSEDLGEDELGTGILDYEAVKPSIDQLQLMLPASETIIAKYEESS